MTDTIFQVELKSSFCVVSARSLASDKPKLLDLFSRQPLWIICIQKSSLSLLNSFSALNKSFHHPSHALVFSNPQSFRTKIAGSYNKSNIYWVEKRHREEIYKALNVIQLPWVLAVEEGKVVYSAHDFPKDFSDLALYREPEFPADQGTDENARKLTYFKEQIQILKKRVKKHEKKEVEYKTEINELKSSIKSLQSEVGDMKRKEHKIIESAAIEAKSPYFAVPKESSYRNGLGIVRKSGNEDIWKNVEDQAAEIRNLNEISESRDLWINNLENKYSIRPHHKTPIKLYPIARFDKSTKDLSQRNNSNKQISPDRTRGHSKRN